MIKNETLKKILPSSILLNPIGKNGNEIWIEDFEQLYHLFFKSVLEIQKADISEFSGFGEFSEDGIPEFSTFKDFLVKSFDDSNDDYWKNWKELFNTSMMKKEFFEKYFNKMIELSSFCENQRFLVNNNLFFGNTVIMNDKVGFLDWNRVAITDWILPQWIYTDLILIYQKNWFLFLRKMELKFQILKKDFCVWLITKA